jgi:DNA-binding MarR family transcriptional regulator
MYTYNHCYHTYMPTKTTSRSKRAPDPEIVDAATNAVLVLSRAMVGVAARSLAATEAEVTLPQYRALVALHVDGEQNVGQLAATLGLHPSTATRLCDRLSSNGYIERSTSSVSRREVSIALSKQGRRLVQTETERRRRAIREIVSRLGEGTQLEIVDALGSLAAAAEDAHGHAWRLGWTA